MKKSKTFIIILTIILIILTVNLCFHIIYFRNIKKNITPVTETEKQKVIEILNKSVNLEDYTINFFRVHNFRDKKFVQIELVKNNSKINYLVDLEKERIIKK